MFSQILEDVQQKGMQISDFVLDGRWHSFIWGGGDKKKGSYRATETHFGVDFQFKNWKDPSLNYSFTLGKSGLSEADLEEHQRRVTENTHALTQRQEMKWKTAQLEAARMWELSREETHPYLERKKLKRPYGTRVNPYGNLLVPVRDADGILWGLQIITPDGKKENLRGSRMKGCFHTIGEINPDGELWLCEGFATAATLHEVTGAPSACTFSSHFFIEAGKNLKAKYPKLKLIFSGDADPVGKMSSQKAARLLKARACVPQFRSEGAGSDWNDLKEIEGEPFMSEQIYHLKAAGDFPEEKFVLESLAALNVSVDLNGSLSIENQGRSVKQLAAAVRVRAARLKESTKRGFIEDYLSEWHPRESKRIRDDFVSQFFSPEKIDPNLTLLRSFMLAFLRRDDELALQAMLHFIWQVKRKMRGLPVEHHMMPVFSGATGYGKSVALKKFLSPLQSLAGTRTLDIFKDDRVWGYFENHYVVFFDEMSKSAKHAESLKMVVTASDFDIEPKYEGLRKARQNSTFIGATNYTLETIIPDETSNRRFFSIETTEPTHRDIINTLDYLALWQSIDETMTCPITEVLTDVKAKQETSRNKSNVEMFLDDGRFQKTDQDAGPTRIGIDIRDLLKFYDLWRRENGFDYGLNTRNLATELKRLGIKKFESNGKTGHFLHGTASPTLIDKMTVFFETSAKPI